MFLNFYSEDLQNPMSLARVAFIGLKEKSRDIPYFDDNGKPFEQVANLTEAQVFNFRNSHYIH